MTDPPGEVAEVEPGGEAAPPGDDFLPGTTWRWRHPIIATIAGLVGVIVAGLAVAIAKGDVDPESVFTANELLGVVTPAQFLAGFLALWAMLMAKNIRSWRIGYGLTLRLSDWWAFFAGIGLQIGAGLLLGLLGLVFFQGVDPPEQSAVELAGAVTGLAVVAAVITIVIAAPIFEEIVFRGMLLSTSLRAMPPWPAYLLNGLAFGGLHVVFDFNAWFASIALLPIGTALAWMAHRGRSLSRPIFAHMGINALGALGLFFADDLQRWAEDLQDGVGAIVRFAGLG